MLVEALESLETSTKILLKLCKNAFGIYHLLYDLYQVVRYNGGSLGYCSYSGKKADCSQYGLRYRSYVSNIRQTTQDTRVLDGETYLLKQVS